MKTKFKVLLFIALSIFGRGLWADSRLDICIETNGKEVVYSDEDRKNQLFLIYTPNKDVSLEPSRLEYINMGDENKVHRINLELALFHHNQNTVVKLRKNKPIAFKLPHPDRIREERRFQEGSVYYRVDWRSLGILLTTAWQEVMTMSCSKSCRLSELIREPSIVVSLDGYGDSKLKICGS